MRQNYLRALAAGIFMLTAGVTWAQTPSNNACSGAMLLIAATDTTCNATLDSLAGATQETAPGTCAGKSSTAANDVWFKFAATGTSQLINVNSPSMGMVVEVYTACGSTTPIACGNPQIISFGAFTFARPGLTSVKATALTKGTIYYVRVYNFGAAVPKRNPVFAICISSPPAPPANDLCSGAINLNPATDTTCNAVAGTLFGANQENQADSSAGVTKSTAANDVWYSFTANSTKEVIDVTSTTEGMFVGLYANCSGTYIAGQNPQVFSFAGNNFPRPGTTTLNANVTKGIQYFVRLYAYNNASPTPKSTFSICVHAAPPPPANDLCSAPIVVTASADSTCNATAGTLYGANQELALDSCAGAKASATAYDVWYKFTASATTQIIDVNSNTFGAVAVLYSTCGGTPIACANPAVTFFGPRPGLTTITATGLTVSSTYLVRVYSYSATAPAKNDNFTICVHTPPPAPVNDLCSNAVSLTVGTSCTPVMGTLVGANQEALPDSCSGVLARSAYDVWYKFTAVQAAQTIEVGSQNVRSIVVLYDACGGKPVACANPAGGPPPPPGQTMITTLRAFGLTTGKTYYVRIYENVNAQPRKNGDFGICVYKTAAAPVNDECAGAIAVNVAKTKAACTSPFTVNTNGATRSSNIVSCDFNNSTDDDVWYSFIANDTTIYAAGSNFSAGIRNFGAALYIGGCNGAEDTSNCSTGNRNDTIVFHNLNRGTKYYMDVFTAGNGATGTFQLCLYALNGKNVGIAENAMVASSLNVYPNPTKDQLHISFEAKQFANIKMVNMNGQVVYEENQVSSNGTYNKNIDMTNLAKGIYMLQVTTDKETITRKVVRD